MTRKLEWTSSPEDIKTPLYAYIIVAPVLAFFWVRTFVFGRKYHVYFQTDSYEGPGGYSSSHITKNRAFRLMKKFDSRVAGPGSWVIETIWGDTIFTERRA